MKITRSQLRQLITEEIGSIDEPVKQDGAEESASLYPGNMGGNRNVTLNLGELEGQLAEYEWDGFKSNDAEMFQYWKNMVGKAIAVAKGKDPSYVYDEQE